MMTRSRSLFLPGRCSLELGQEHLHASNVGELALGGEEQEPGKGHGGPQGHLVSPARQAGLLRHMLIISGKGRHLILTFHFMQVWGRRGLWNNSH